VGAIARTIQRAPGPLALTRRGYARFVLIAAAAAFVVAGAALWRSRPSNEPVVAWLSTQLGASHALVRGREVGSPSQSSNALALTVDSQIATDRDSSSRLRLLSGADIALGPETHLVLPDTKDTLHLHEELRLEDGTIRVHVPPLPKGHSFAVRTPNATVSVHGTSFSVTVTNGGVPRGSRTQVVVTEGVVTVQHADGEILLSAGSEWNSAADPSAGGVASDTKAGGSETNPAEKGEPLHTKEKAVPRASRTPASAASDTDSTGVGREAFGAATELADQNRFFAEAMNARDRGDPIRAIVLLNDFVHRYPSCPLTQDAYVARFRLLAQNGDRAAAASAARGYLSLYPNGVAAEEARALESGLPR
jgi:hypothetical protein